MRSYTDYMWDCSKHSSDFPFPTFLIKIFQRYNTLSSFFTSTIVFVFSLIKHRLCSFKRNALFHTLYSFLFHNLFLFVRIYVMATTHAYMLSILACIFHTHTQCSSNLLVTNSSQIMFLSHSVLIQYMLIIDAFPDLHYRMYFRGKWMSLITAMSVWVGSREGRQVGNEEGLSTSWPVLSLHTNKAIRDFLSLGNPI